MSSGKIGGFYRLPWCLRWRMAPSPFRRWLCSMASIGTSSSGHQRCRFRSAVSRILSPAPRGGSAFIYLSRRGGISAEAECGIPGIIGRAARSPILPCTGMGLSCLLCYLRSGELLPPLFTLTLRQAQGGIFSVTLSVPTGYPAGPPLSRGILPYGVRTFLSSNAQANAHTPKSTKLKLSC